MMQASHSVAEEYLRTLNAAATKIQRWFKRHQKRRQAGEAAMRRLLQQKREDVLRQSAVLQEDQQHRQEDRKRVKEEKARQARLDAIQVSKAAHSGVLNVFSFLSLYIDIRCHPGEQGSTLWFPQNVFFLSVIVH